jgi:hypothetical protein
MFILNIDIINPIIINVHFAVVAVLNFMSIFGIYGYSNSSCKVPSTVEIVVDGKDDKFEAFVSLHPHKYFFLH